MSRSEMPTPEDDGLLTPSVGEHYFDKHHFLSRYIKAFTTAMRNKQWDSLHYIDLFAGAGMARLKESGRLDWGSPLIAAHTDPPFDVLHLCEERPDMFTALKRRLEAVDFTGKLQLVPGDANERVHDIVAEIPRGSLSLAFLDPYGLHLDYETVRVLAERRCDLVVYFPDRLDALRNWKMNYHDDRRSNLDRVLGPNADWRAIFKAMPRPSYAEQLRKLYEKQLRLLGYRFLDHERIYSRGSPIYQLVFCSRHHLGADIWRRVAKKKPDGQDTFDFGPTD